MRHLEITWDFKKKQLGVHDKTWEVQRRGFTSTSWDFSGDTWRVDWENGGRIQDFLRPLVIDHVMSCELKGFFGEFLWVTIFSTLDKNLLGN